MRLAAEGQAQIERNWPDPTDLELVTACAALLGFTLNKSDEVQYRWRLDLGDGGNWFLYGTLQGEIQGPWIPENDKEWVYALERFRRESLLTTDWLNFPTIKWEFPCE